MRKRLNRYSCALCIDNYPSQALDFIQGHSHLDQLQCTTCGQCIAICPSEAFESAASNIYRNLTNKETDTILFSCSCQQATTPEEIVVPC